MKKITLTLLALVCALCCLFGFVACDPTPQGNEVTEKQWKEAFGNKENFTLLFWYHDPDTKEDVLSATVKFDLPKISVEGEFDGFTEIHSKEGDKYYIYEYEDSVWTKTETSSNEYESGVFTYSMPIDLLANAYKSFSYSNGKYTLKDGAKLSVINKAEVVFTDGKLDSAEFSMYGEDEASWEYKNFGSTTVTLPTNFNDKKDDDDVIPDGEEVTAKTWEECFGAEPNFTMEILIDSGEWMCLKIDGTKKMMTQSWDDNIQIMSEEDGAYYQYEYKNSVWKKTTISSSDYSEADVYALFLKCLINDYDEFTYEDGVYYCSELTKDLGLDAELVLENIEVVFDNGNLYSLSFNVNSETSSVQFTKIGRTTIELPNVDDNGDNNDAQVAGITFHCYDFAINNADGENYDKLKATWQTSTVEFGRDGTVTITLMDGSYVMIGKYEVKGENITLYIVEATQDGQPADIGEGAIFNATYKNGSLVLTGDSGAFTVYYK